MGPILANISCQFKAPGTYPDTWICGTQLMDIQVCVVTYNDVVCFVTYTVVVCVSHFITHFNAYFITYTTLNNKETEFTLKHKLWSVKEQVVTAEGEGRVVIFDYQRNKKAPMDPLLFQTLQSFQEGGIEDEGREGVLTHAAELMEHPPLI